MSPQVAKSCAAALIPSVITLLLVQACGGSDDVVAQPVVTQADLADPIEGVWESTVTLRDCTTNAEATVPPPFRSAQVFHRGGTFTDTSSHAPSTRGPGFGQWSRSDDTYTVKVRFFRYNPDGSFAGTNIFTLSATLAADGKSFSATRSTQVLDLAGNTLTTVCANDVSTKIS